jgi:hypothetical protein
MDDIDFVRIRDDALNGPRVTTLMPHFEKIASGLSQAPRKDVVAEPSFLSKSSDYQHYHDIFQRNLGAFYKHLCASIPFFIEQQCRVGVAMQKFAQHRSRTEDRLFTLYETSSADGTNARTVSEYSQGLIRTLTDSPNLANSLNFRNLCRHNYSDIHVGPFVDITPEYLLERFDRPYFHSGFDFIYENTTFQMYGPDRNGQIAYVKRVLKEDGLMILCEKLLHPIHHEYERREAIKDDLFKSKYFTKAEIVQKSSQILEEMEKCQVTLDGLISAISCHFRYAYLIWNSTNFYEIVASNNKSVLQDFLGFLGECYVPYPFLCEENAIRKLL